MSEHTSYFPTTISGSRAASSALRHRLQGRDPCGVLVVILRGRLYVSLPTCDRKLTAMETGALQTLHRAVAGFDSIPPPVVIQSAGGLTQLIPKERIEGRRDFKRSLMYDPVTLGLTAQDIADLSAWLRSYR